MKILNGPISCCHEQMKKLLEAPSREYLAAQHKERKGDYFVHKCIKILAKRERGNRFPMHGIREFGHDKSREQKRKQIQAF